MSYGSPTGRVSIRGRMKRALKKGRPCYVCQRTKNPLSLYVVSGEKVCYTCIHNHAYLLQGVL